MAFVLGKGGRAFLASAVIPTGLARDKDRKGYKKEELATGTRCRHSSPIKGIEASDKVTVMDLVCCS